MESILVLTHTDDNSALTKPSLEAVNAGLELATKIKAQLTIGILAADPNAAAAAVAASGASILAVSGEAFAQARYSTDSAACTSICRAAMATIVLAPASSRIARVAAGVALRMGGVIDTHITALAATPCIEVTRWFYRQRIEAVLNRATRPWFLLLESGTHAPFFGGPGTASFEPVAVDVPAPRTTVLGIRQTETSQQTIRPDAKLLFVAGAGWTRKQPDGQVHAAEGASLILGFINATGASLGSSKSLVDQGSDGQPVLPFLTHMNQVGQTGSSPRHPKGLATCCHGEEPHVVGWRFIGERRAISLDPNCGWTRGKADVVYISDAFAVMREVNALLEAKKS